MNIDDRHRILGDEVSRKHLHVAGEYDHVDVVGGQEFQLLRLGSGLLSITQYPMPIINIPHSFLPAFIGAKPHHQAYERGVKLIGATAHYVTEILDDGPIIEQS